MAKPTTVTEPVAHIDRLPEKTAYGAMRIAIGAPNRQHTATITSLSASGASS
jgi:hypothetical protein